MSTFETLKFGTIDLFPHGINNNGEIVGTYVPESGGFEQGFIDSMESIRILDPINAQYAWAMSVSNSGNITGWGSESSGLFAYSYIHGSFQTINVPGAANTLPTGINDRGQIVGTFFTPGDPENQIPHGFIYGNGRFSALSAPGGGTVTPYGINNSGEIVGTYSLGGQEHGFLYRKGNYTNIDFPGGEHTVPTGINSSGEIVGYYQDESFRYHGFIDHKGTFETIDEPDGNYATWPQGINDRGEIVGIYVNTESGSHGFLLA
jgi:probable HAF family extracellular repeat protein